MIISLNILVNKLEIYFAPERQNIVSVNCSIEQSTEKNGLVGRQS